MNFKSLNAVVLIALILISSCTSYKNVPYFQNLKRDSVSAIKEKITNFSPLLIQPGDLLAIHVTSLNHEADAAINYNLIFQPQNTLPSIDHADQNAVLGYLVDPIGNIHLPYVGNVKVSGMTTLEISSALESKLSEYLSKPNFEVRLQNFKISVIGDVLRPGSFGSTNERITVTEALALAGDLNATGYRDILLIREINGNREYITLDLTSKKIFNSPYYYLKNNDVIYVQPNKQRVAATDNGFQKVSIIISALSVLALFLNSFK